MKKKDKTNVTTVIKGTVNDTLKQGEKGYLFKHILITGISGEVGFNLAKYFIEHKLVENLSVCSRSDQKDQELKDFCSIQGKHKVNLNIAHFDIKDDLALENFIVGAYQLAPLDLVIANAGVSLSKDQNGLEDLYEINRAFDVNSKATIKTLFFALKAYQEDQNASLERIRPLHLVAISSLASLLPMGGSPLYVASKCAINSYLQALENSMRNRKFKQIKTTLVLAGFIKSAMSARYVGGKSSIFTADRAAKIIVEGIIKGKKQIAFPKYLYWLIKGYNLLPSSLSRMFNKFLDFDVQADKDRQSFLKRKNLK